ncbi:major facilitator superfamily domain-containing protein 8-like isoform X2 [Armigeres subalbatus]|uniref:major facilitator superfamily domain-containing protein 8-like isoform X2 n=1 Tax=Armigeres subalbatus TaxID=124917 RepID=UPI002ED0E7D8
MGVFGKLFTLTQSESDRLLGLESASEYRERWISIRVIYFMGFTIYLAFAIVATSMWPYLRSLDPAAEKVFLTYVFAIPSLLQLAFSPVFGWWNNRIKSIRMPMVFFLITFIVGHVLYAVIGEIKVHEKYLMVVSRGLIGMSTVSCTIYRAYMSSATTVPERTKAMSFLSLAQTSGMLVGSALQPIFSLLGEDGFLFMGSIKVNMYTAVAWFCTALGCINLVLMMPSVFNDHQIALKEALKGHGPKTSKAVWQSTKLDFLPINLMLAAFALLMFVYTTIQTLLSPIALDQFGWTNEESLFYLGILMTVGALISCVLFLLLDPLCKRFGESNVLVYGAMFALFLSQLMLIPFGSEPITSVTEVGNLTELHNSTTVASGCPLTQEWCQRIPPISKVQFTISYTLLCVSFSIGTTLSQAVFSKLLGPRPQGTWMALLTCAGSAARILGPGSVTLYVLFGTYWTFGAGSVLAGLVFIWMWVYRNTLQPAKPVVPPEMAEELKVLNSKNIVQ